jgi:C4-dicarboxylate transporter DctM subunit
MVGSILFICFLVFLILGIPIGFVLALSSIGAITYAGYPITIFAQRMFTGLDSFPLMAIPLFMLTGVLMNYSGITKRIINFVLAFVGNITGSLAQVIAISGVIMGGISGSGVADTAALGSVMIPEMVKRKYDVGFAAALTACSGSIGLIIPPSIAIIVFGVTTGASIGDMFLAAVVPGVLIGLGFMTYSYFFAKKRGYPKEGSVSRQEKWKRFKDAIWALVMPVIIVVGIRGGIFTPTEGGAVAAVYALIVGMFIYREIHIKDLLKICMEAAVSTAVISTIIATTSLFSWLLSSEQIPQQISMAMLNLTSNKFLLLLLINAVLLFTGMFIDSSPAILLLAPILAPVAASLGVNMVQFGLVMVINLTMGLLTPPVGTAMYVASNVAGVPILKLSKSILPFLGIMLLVLMMITYIPALTVWAT